MSNETPPLTPEEITHFNEALIDYLTHHNNSRLEELFNIFDRNKNGSINSEELKMVMETISGRALTNEKVQHIIESADVNSDGQIDIKEFITVMKRLND